MPLKTVTTTMRGKEKNINGNWWCIQKVAIVSMARYPNMGYGFDIGIVSYELANLIFLRYSDDICTQVKIRYRLLPKNKPACEGKTIGVIFLDR